MSAQLTVVRPGYRIRDLVDTTDVEQAELDRINARLIVARDNSREALFELLPEADGFMAFGVVTREMVEAMPKCRAILTISHGFNAMDLDVCTEAGIPVSNTRYNQREVSTHAMGLLIAVARKTLDLHSTMTGDGWPIELVSQIPPIYGETLGILGLGNIGREVAKRANAFDMTVIACDPYIDPAVADEYNVELVDYDELFRRSDYISLHVPLNKETRHIVNERALAMMKPTAILINTCRGPVVDEEALYQVLEAGRIRGAGLDVFDVEPTPAENPLRRLDNVVLTPHIAGYSAISMTNGRREAARKMVHMLSGYYPEPLLNHAVRGRTRFPFRDAED